MNRNIQNNFLTIFVIENMKTIKVNFIMIILGIGIVSLNVKYQKCSESLSF
jgi:hypothetical protein